VLGDVAIVPAVVGETVVDDAGTSVAGSVPTNSLVVLVGLAVDFVEWWFSDEPSTAKVVTMAATT
jgi:hypothetical protein